MLNVSPDPAPSLQSPNPAHRHTAAVRPPRGCAVLRAGTAARLRDAAPYCALAAAARPVTGDTPPYHQRPAELHNPQITQATYMSIWESAHLAGRRCRVEIRPPCRAPVPCGNPPTLPGAGAVWKSAHLHDKNLSNDRLMCADLCQTGFCLSIIENRNFPESSILYLASKGVFSFICLSAGSRKDRFNSAKFFCWDSGKTKRSFNQA